jgi:hypothetical protein
MNFYLNFMQNAYLLRNISELKRRRYVRSAEKLGKVMEPGRVYRRQDLAGFTTAVDRDLQTLVRDGQVRKAHGGLYFRPHRNAFGFAPPRDEDLVRAFLKSEDFLVTSYNHFNALGLGLTQLYGETLVYNHKRFGMYVLGGKRFRFLRVPAFPRELSREYLVVDLLNHLDRLPDDAARVRRNLPLLLSKLDKDALRINSTRYGRPATRRVLQDVV